ncbi:MAG: hypothetical protein WAK82_26650 [Streptosporangiaceae bacterium]
MLAADLGVPAHHREAAHLDLDAVGDVDGGPAHERVQVQGELAALDFGLAQVNLVAAHDGQGVDGADGPEPAAPVRATHDGDQPADRLAGHRDGHGLGLTRLLRQVAGQRGKLAAGPGAQGTAGALLELVQREPTRGRMLGQHVQRGVSLGVRDPEGFVRIAHDP